MEMRSNQSIGEIIRYYRLLKNISQKELAEDLNVTESAVSAWERGLTKPALDIAIRFSEAMVMPLEDFYFMPKKANQGNQYQVFELIKMKRCFIELTELEVDLSHTILRLTYSVTGLTVDETYVQNELKLTLTTPSKTLEPTKKLILEKTWIRPEISPELNIVPFEAPRYLIQTEFFIDKLEDITLTIKENGTLASLSISSVMLDLLHQLKQPENDPLLIPEHSIHDFTSIFLLYSKHHPNYLQEHFKRFHFS